jgi:H+-transporting ATPase
MKNQPDNQSGKASPDESAGELDIDLEQGLSDSEAKRRLEQNGPNAIEQNEHSVLLTLLSHFWGPIPWMIEIATILSAVAGRWDDFSVILTMLLINGAIGFWQEHSAQNAIQALKDQLAPEASVIRGGEEKKIDAQQLVVGDLIVIRMGDVVPADVKLAGDSEVSVDESALTGESIPVDKEAGDAGYSGTSVKRGETRAVVSAIGNQTKFARTVDLVAQDEEKSHFEKAVLRIGYYLIGLTGVLVAAVIIVGLVRADPVWDVILFALVLTIAGIPSALPAVMTTTMAIGARRLARMKAIVSRLAAMEEMAGLSILCVDKTGTITKNELELQEPVVFDAEDGKDLILAAALTTRRKEQDPIDLAVLGGLEDPGVLDQFQIKNFRPFDPTHKRAEADVTKDGEEFTVAKGAPQAILKLVGAEEHTEKKVQDKVEELGKDGFRALGVARCKAGGKWQYLGLLSLLDPPRDDSAQVVKDSLSHGLQLRMVTGDHGAIARQVAKQVGLGQNIHPAGDLVPENGDKGNEKKKEPKFDAKILDADGFSEVTPAGKFHLIKAFQRQDHIVGMTGDGVNDVPALKQADVGVAVSSATDAARATADLVLTQPGLGVIINAVEEARRIFERMIAYATYRITETIRLLLFMSLSIFIYNFYPVTAIMVVLLAILNDIPIIAIATDNVRTVPNPVRWDMRRVLTVSTVLGFAGVVAAFGLFWYVKTYMNVSREVLQTILFLKLLVAGHMTIFLTRNVGWLWQQPWPNWKLVLALEGTQILGTVAAVYGWFVTPIGWTYALAVWGYALAWLFVNNAVKVLIYQWVNPIGKDGMHDSEERVNDDTSGVKKKTGHEENNATGERK